MRNLAMAIVLAVCSTGFVCRDDEPGAPRSPSWGGDLHNTHHARDEVVIDRESVRGLSPRWVVDTTGSVSAIPTVSDTRVYFTDWGAPGIGGGNLWAIDRADGSVLAKEAITKYTGNLLHDVSRSSPVIAGDLLIIGDLRNQPSSVLGIPGAHGAMLYAIDRRTGALRWKTLLDPHPLAITTQSPTVYDGTVYVGTSSYEEPASKLGYDCCSFRGSMVAVDLATGAIRWRREMTPGGGFTGAAVWGSSPAIDEARGVVYIATGNNYTVSDQLASCVVAHHGDPAAQADCYAALDVPDNYAESVLALDLVTGAVRWARKLRNWGAWTFACDPSLAPWVPSNPDNCQDFDSLDYDFGQAPMLLTTAEGAPRDLVVVGQKSGVLWAFDPDAAGETVWATTIGPGGVLGGMEFGSATDGQRVYVAITNIEHTEFDLVAGLHPGERVRGGIWAAVDAATGAIRWQTADPASFLPLEGDLVHPVWGSGLGAGFFGVLKGPLTVANGVLFGGSLDPDGHMYALDTDTGEILWSFASGGSVNSAPAVVDGVVYWGSGYSTGFDNDKFYAFAPAP